MTEHEVEDAINQAQMEAFQRFLRQIEHKVTPPERERKLMSAAFKAGFASAIEALQPEEAQADV